jgi:hypothetical protein
MYREITLRNKSIFQISTLVYVLYIFVNYLLTYLRIVMFSGVINTATLTKEDTGQGRKGKSRRRIQNGGSYT